MGVDKKDWTWWDRIVGTWYRVLRYMFRLTPDISASSKIDEVCRDATGELTESHRLAREQVAAPKRKPNRCSHCRFWELWQHSHEQEKEVRCDIDPNDEAIVWARCTKRGPCVAQFKLGAATAWAKTQRNQGCGDFEVRE